LSLPARDRREWLGNGRIPVVRKTRANMAATPLFDLNQLDLNRVAVDREGIYSRLPHRHEFMQLDAIVHLDSKAGVAVGLRHIRNDEFWVRGHIPGQPIMPGVLIIESMAQLGGILMAQELEHTGKVAVLLSLDKVKFRRAVMPGDQLILEAEAIRVKSRTGHVKCQARVGDAHVAEAIIKFMLVDADPL
jgi:beta-hydroxyacyl-ACP dehydratase FabZ